MPFKTITNYNVYKENTLDTITPNKTWQIYRKELAGMSKILMGGLLGSGSEAGMLQPAYKPKSKFESLPPGGKSLQQIGKINTCLKEIKPGQLRDENQSYFSRPSLHSPIPAFFLPSSPPQAVAMVSGLHREPMPCRRALPCPDGLLKNAEMPGKGYITPPKALK